MPPARKNVYPCDVDQTSVWNKLNKPNHYIDLGDIWQPENKGDSKIHFILKVKKYTPEEIHIKQNENTLTVESKNTTPDAEGKINHVLKHYKIPEGGYNKEFGDKLSVDGFISLAGIDTTKPPDYVYSFKLQDAKPGSIMKLYPGPYPKDNMDNAQEHKQQQEGNAGEADAADNLEDYIQDVRLDDSA